VKLLDIGRRVLVAGLVAAGLSVAVAPTAAQAYIDPYPDRVAFFTPHGWASAQIGGDWDGIVIIQHTYPAYDVAQKWKWSKESYVLNGSRYYNLRDVDTNECLSHIYGLLLTEPCVFNDNSQWWATEEHSIPCAWPCLPVKWHLVKSWDFPDLVVTDTDGLLMLQARVGTTGSAAQRMEVRHIPAPPW